jgi:uncharacterized membrane protein YcjF (UPF0283 family)
MPASRKRIKKEAKPRSAQAAPMTPEEIEEEQELKASRLPPPEEAADQTKRFFMTLAVVAILSLLTFAVLQSLS